MKRISKKNGFTFLEIAAIIIVFGLLAAVTVPRYQELASDSKETSARICLGSLRTDITIFYANQALKNGRAAWPSPYDFEIVGNITKDPIPVNPYQALDRAPDSIIICYESHTVNSERGGWAYNPETGEVWLNTNSIGENNW